ncbi:phage head closure protein [Bacillus gobiensis]|uniref:Head-tail adaptor protein n=1 Tax=Bacillus gobiensis TaxID=1441095 RepID=A0A0M4G6F1_9BACI|nr:phage head closure protein [Bacillus gobiensis]ALC80445.1 head-tail adaptor protein [Bacillus gobiensis]
MNPGKFRHRIIFQQINPGAVDEEGFPLPDGQWADVMKAWAMAKTVSGREYHEASATQNERTTRFIIRYRNGLSEDMRVKYQDRIFEIEAILPDDEVRKTLTVVCKEAVQ